MGRSISVRARRLGVMLTRLVLVLPWRSRRGHVAVFFDDRTAVRPSYERHAFVAVEGFGRGGCTLIIPV